MLKAITWFRHGSRHQRTVLAVASASAFAAGLATYQNRHPLLADGGEYAPAWKSKPSVVSHNLPLSDRLKAITGNEGTKTRDADYNKPGEHAPPPQTKGHALVEAEEGESDDGFPGWHYASSRISGVCDSFVGFDFIKFRDRLSDAILPSWVKMLPGLVTKLQNEISMAPWSLGWEIWEDAHNPEANPEITWDAHVRLSNELCLEEQIFLRKRRTQTTKALARYLDVPERDIHPDDVPIIAMCGSGGGLRALVAGTASYVCAQDAGLFDCVTYTAGVSGSCWLQTLYYSTIGQQSHARILDHLKQRLGVHIAFPPAALSLLAQAPTNKYLLSGIVEKLRGVPDADFGLVDIYGLLLAARLLVPKGELRISDLDLKVSNQQYYVNDGQHPLPIYTAVRHEIPEEQDKPDAEKSSQKTAQPKDKKGAFFQWFEWTPYEFFCEEWEAGIPTWAVGRRFDNGQGVWRENGLALPEVKMPFLLGTWGSAFCATLSHYYKEIRPILKTCGMGGFETLMAEKDEDLIKVHPIDPASIPNYALGLRDKLPSTCPESVHSAQHLRLMDAGMSNNLPIYPILRPGRSVDVIMAFDASADVKTDNWIQVVDGYARQRGIKGWPLGAGWPPKGNEKQQTVKELDSAQSSSSQDAEAKLQEAKKHDDPDADLGYCTVWVGTTTEKADDDGELSKRLLSEEDDKHITAPNAGLALIYAPFLANPKVPGVDPMKSEFMSTWNFVYTPEEIDKVVALARANFDEGKEQVRRTIRAVWERKRQKRLESEKAEREFKRRRKIRRGEPFGRKGQGDHGDHFS